MPLNGTPRTLQTVDMFVPAVGSAASIAQSAMEAAGATRLAAYAGRVSLVANAAANDLAIAQAQASRPAGQQASQIIADNRMALSATFTRNSHAYTVGAIVLEANNFFTEFPNFMPPQIRHSTVTDFARFLGLCGRLTSLREVSVHQTALRAFARRARHSTVTLLARLRGLW